MNHARVAHMWAAHNTGLSRFIETVVVKGARHDTSVRVKPEGRGSRISFKGPTISSYHWWPMARFERNDSGEQAVIYRSARYSSSTSGHQSMVRAALRKQAPDVPIFSVDDDINESHGTRIKGYMQRIRAGFDAALKARTRAIDLITSASETHEEMLSYARFFAVDIPLWATPFATPEEVVRMEAKLAELSIKTGITINSFWRAS